MKARIALIGLLLLLGASTPINIWGLASMAAETGVSATPIAPSITVKVPMRDGVELLTDIYLPTPDAKNLPALLIRSPAGRRAAPALAHLSLLKEGYVIAIQDTRSASDPEGKIMPCFNDGDDGYDAVEWLAKAPYTNGKIGSIGTSALGIAQLMLAPTCPSALKAQYILFACGSVFHHAAYPQGQLHKHQIESWLGYYAKDPSHTKKLRKERHYCEFWRKLDASSRAHQVRIPALFIAGWYDTFLSGTLDAFLARQYRGGHGARGEQKLVIGPWAHFWPVVRKIGDYDIPLNGQTPPVDLSAERWFAHYLKGEDNGIEKMAPVTYYVMGPFDGTPSKGNVWKSAESWPVPATPTPFYLTADKGLSEKRVETATKVYPYTYNPHDPAPTLGGRNLFIESGPKDQRPLEGRSDVIVFTTPPLEHDVEVTGCLQAKIFFTTDAHDTDLALRLTDVYPDGRSLLISDNTVRLGSLTKDACCVTLDRPHEIDVDLHAISMVFAKGHKIRLSITSSNYPRFEKNLNIPVDEEGNPKGDAKPAHNAVWVGLKTPSRLILPLVN